MVLDPMSLIMFGLIAVLIFFMFRNGKKRQQAMQELQNNVKPGAEVMLQSGIFATIIDVDDEENRVTVQSGTSTFVVHRNAIGQVVTPVDAPEESAADLAPDDDPEFGERLETRAAAGDPDAAPEATSAADTGAEPTTPGSAAPELGTEFDGEEKPKG